MLKFFLKMDKKDLDGYTRVPLVSLPDTIPAWHDDVPLIPGVSTTDPSGKSNGNVYDEIVLSDYCDDIEKLSHYEKVKVKVISGKIKENLSHGELKLLGCSTMGFVTDDIRRVLWPKLLRINEDKPPDFTELIGIHEKIPDSVYQQILKDVARSGGHLPADSTEAQYEAFEHELMQIICWVLHRHPELKFQDIPRKLKNGVDEENNSSFIALKYFCDKLFCRGNYYQGYNDVAATVLLVMGVERGLQVLEKITVEYLERFMEQTMEKVNQELFYIFALLERVHPTLLEHLENVELFPHFALAEYTTWYAHKYAEKRKLLHRLFDFFLGTPILMPLYLSTVIVAHRDTEIFNTTPDMGHTHKVLCTLPDDLPFEDLLIKAKNLYRDYPPESISTDVIDFDHKRRCKEREWKRKAEASRLERERLRQLKVSVPQPRIPYRLSSYRTITVVTILAIGLYAFLKTGSGLN